LPYTSKSPYIETADFGIADSIFIWIERFVSYQYANNQQEGVPKTKFCLSKIEAKVSLLLFLISV
jgi:hypothetical protein